MTYSLNSNDVHVWLVCLDDFDLEETKLAVLPWLTARELQRYERLQFEEHRHQLLASRLFTRTILSRYCAEVKKESWHFSINKHGRPDIDALASGVPDVKLSFNLSHSRGMAAIALSAAGDVGVDIEECQRPRRVEKIFQRYFSKQEQQDLQNKTSAAQLSYFYQLWTLKEAYIKACGKGLAIPLDHFNFRVTGQDIEISFAALREDNAKNWQFWQSDELSPAQRSVTEPAEKFRIAVARKVNQDQSTQQSERKATAKLADVDALAVRVFNDGETQSN